ncbi:MAG TPA: hypothetical protein VKU41_18480 [Polyangiaceae bacterium]|nr:hypothetical protein [Polyangiaceae bacterium]
MPLRTNTAATALGAILCAALSLLGACGTDSSGAKGPDASGSSPNCAPSRASCTSGGDCCSGSCSSGQCTCMSFAALCHGDADCCEDLACDHNGRCSFGCRSDGTSCTTGGANCCSGACVGGICGPPRCITTGGSCDSSGDCCDGLGCVIEGDAGRGACQPGCAGALGACGGTGKAPFCCSGTACAAGVCVVACRGTDLSCTHDNECCDSFACVGGKCRACSGSGGTCANSGDCCAGTCQHKECVCQAKGASCASDADCCARLHCMGGSCACQDAAATCASDDDCCEGLACHEGHCGALACLDTGFTLPQALSCTGCCSGACGSDRQTCCAQIGWGCDARHGCCSTDFCNASGACQACLSDGTGASCTNDGQCCSGHCESGACCSGSYNAPGSVPSVPDAGGAPVACGGAFCCAGLECCNDGFPPRCTQKNGTTCTNDADCCQLNADGGGANGGCHNGVCCFTASPYTRCVADSDCCQPARCAAQTGKSGPQVCCWPSGMSCTDFMCGNCCSPPPTPPIGQTATCL